ncbi:MAG: type III secretion chaperone [Verrucomicrobia bacterium]|nr:type III secretion chaperone [Verrucomicrobiota bacterium]MDE3046974.1 type III secretion chaperone [Verrucomicrobiota bacterium]
MSQLNWLEILGWGAGEVNDLRTVGYSYIQQGIYDVALTFFDTLTILAPPLIYDLQTIGALHLQLGNGLKALDFLDRALKLDPDHLLTQLNRAKALFMLGYKRQGLAAALSLQKCENPEIAAQASALVLAYQ